MTLVGEIVRAVLALGVLLGVCVLCSHNRRAIDWWLVGRGLLLQLVLAVLMLKVPYVQEIVGWVVQGFVAVLGFSREGAVFVFGDLGDPNSFAFNIAFQVLPVIVFFAALTSVLYYVGIMQRIVQAFAWVMSRTMHISGAESFAAAANVFVGQTEAPLAVKPYIAKMSRSEILCLMTGGLATIAGSVFLAYVSLLGGEDTAAQVLFGKHLLTASVLSAPAAIVAAKILWPETETVDRELITPRMEMGSSFFDAVIRGANEGLMLALNVAAALIVFTAGVALVNAILSEGLGSWTGLNAWIAGVTGGQFEGLSLQLLFALVFAPVAWLLGVGTDQLLVVGQLLGEKTVLNEFIAYVTMSGMLADGTLSGDKAVIVTAYALCGFANFASIGVLVGGISVLAPTQRPVLAQMALRALLGGTVACLLTAVFASVLV